MAFKDARRCTAIAKSTGERCKNPARRGYNVCSVHGAGKGKKRGGRPITTGRYSKLLPYDLLERYEASRNDPELLNLRDEIALLDAHIQDLTGHLSSGGPATWSQVEANVKRAAEALKEGKLSDVHQGLEAAMQALEQSEADQSTWAELLVLLEQRRKLVESERKRLVELQQVITAERAMTLIVAVVDVVRQHVVDRNTISAIAADIRSLVAGSGGLHAGGGGRGKPVRITESAGVDAEIPDHPG